MAVSDAKMGELPAAVVVLRANAGKVTEQDIIEDARKHLPRHSVPVFVMLRSPKDESSELRIERNPNGKIVKSGSHRKRTLWFCDSKFSQLTRLPLQTSSRKWWRRSGKSEEERPSFSLVVEGGLHHL